jgi:hypothetical protein
MNLFETYCVHLNNRIVTCWVCSSLDIGTRVASDLDQEVEELGRYHLVSWFVDDNTKRVNTWLLIQARSEVQRSKDVLAYEFNLKISQLTHKTVAVLSTDISWVALVIDS